MQNEDRHREQQRGQSGQSRYGDGEHQYGNAPGDGRDEGRDDVSGQRRHGQSDSSGPWGQETRGGYGQSEVRREGFGSGQGFGGSGNGPGGYSQMGGMGSGTSFGVPHDNGEGYYGQVGPGRAGQVGRDFGQGSSRGGYGQSSGSSQSGRTDRPQDPHYSSWRQAQMDAFDRDYEEYRRERQSSFNSDFEEWRQKRRASQSVAGGQAEGSSSGTAQSGSGSAGEGTGPGGRKS